MSNEARAVHFEIWSRTQDGQPHRHGSALGLTFQDACKHLASECVDFWTHYDKGRYQGRRLYMSRAQAEAASEGS